MAFAKAKIQRFNEVKGCAPPPGTYQPKWSEKPMLGLFERSKRFIDEKTSKETFETSTIQTPRLQRKRCELNLQSSRRQTYQNTVASSSVIQHESFSSSVSAASSVKEENQPGEVEETLLCKCAVLMEEIEKKYQATIKSMLESHREIDPVEQSDICGTIHAKNVLESEERESSLQTINLNLTERASSLQKETIEYRLQIAELQDTIDCITTEKNLLNMDYMKLNKRIKELEEEIKIKNLRVSEAEALAESAGKCTESLRKEIDSMKSELESSKFKIAELEEKFEKASQDVILERARKDSLLEKYEKVLSETRKEAAEKFQKMDDLTDSLNQKLLISEHEQELINEQMECLTVELQKAQELYNSELSKKKETEDELLMTREELTSALKKVEEMSLVKGEIEAVFQENIIEIDDYEEKELLSDCENLTLDKLISFLKSAIKAKNELNEINKTLESQLKIKESHIQNLELLIGPFREQLETYEQERQALENQTRQTKGELEALSLQHAALLGHQNHKQKIQYLVKLKEKNLHLLDEIEDLKGKLRQKERTIAKLSNQTKNEPRTPSASKALHRSRKENSHSS